MHPKRIDDMNQGRPGAPSKNTKSHVFGETSRISIREMPIQEYESEKPRTLAEWLREQASGARERAHKVDKRGARWGLLALATSYDSRADHIEASIAIGNQSQPRGNWSRPLTSP
jgi:hypothetical protein